MRLSTLAIVLAVLFVAACAHRPPAGELRFHNQAPVWRVNDRTPLAAPPKEREYNRWLYHADGFVVRRATRAMDLEEDVRAADVNALGEVPDSTWFTNRIGVRELSLAELRRGANLGPSPFDHKPWTITGGKAGGTAVGFVFEDARGDRYILKFDKKGMPELETGAHAIVHRILWAIGYNVPEDYIGYISRDDLVISPDAKAKDAFGVKTPLTEAALERSLARIERSPDGRYRVLASRFLPGKPIGPYAREGVRADDPNDVIPHERRRSLRGQFSIFSWLNHTDLQEDNTLDAFVKDERGGHVVHYLIDFGNALGVMGAGLKWQSVGHTYRFDWGMGLRTLLTFGLWKRPWDGMRSPEIRGIGLYDAEHYDPGAWRPNSFYWPLEDKDRFDAFWGAKLLMRFSRDQLAAIVDEAQYSDPHASRYMLDTLIARQRATARYWFEQVAPLDRFTVERDGSGSYRLCFTDLTLAYQLRDVATRYAVDAYDHAGAATGYRRALAAGVGGRTCATGVVPAASHDGYTIVRLRVYRGDSELPAMKVHLARDRSGTLAVIGLRRD